jgi:hypothetical protein
VQWLLQRVDLSNCNHALEPFNGAGGISTALRAAGMRCMRTNDLAQVRAADLHEDALQPAFYQQYSKKFGQPDVIVTSPWFSVLDLALPLIVDAVKVVACVHVPGHYIASGLGPRYAYLRQLQRAGRVVVLFGVPRGPMGWRCAWLIVFRSAALRDQLLKTGWRDADGVVLSCLFRSDESVAWDRRLHLGWAVGLACASLQQQHDLCRGPTSVHPETGEHAIYA